MRRRAGTVLSVLGVLMVLAALALFAWNRWEDRQAGDGAADILGRLQDTLDGAAESAAAEEELPVVEIDGYGYIGTLSIPSLDRELPVMDEWDYARLKISPCRYAGSPLTDDFVICAHNYARHFGTIRTLEIGAEVSFTAMDGRTWTYEVAYVGVYAPTDVEEMTSGEYDLMLFTCTYGGKTRVAVGCDLVSHTVAAEQ